MPFAKRCVSICDIDRLNLLLNSMVFYLKDAFMTPFALLGLLGLAFAGFAFAGDDDDAFEPTDQPEEPVPPEEPEQLDLGASFDHTDGTVSIEVGEDETRDLVAIRTEQEARFEGQDDGPRDGIRTEYGVRFYLIDPDMPFPPDVDTVIENLPVDQQGSVVDGFEAAALPLDVYLANIGAEEIGRVDLGGVIESRFNSTTTFTDQRVEEIVLNANRDLTTYEIEGELHSFRADPLDNTVAGDPLTQIPAEDTLAPDVTGADGTVTLDEGVVTVRVDEDAEGDLVAITLRSEFLGSPSCCNGGDDHEVAFYLLPEGTPFPPDALQLADAAPINSEIGERVDQGIERGGSIFVDFENVMETIGAVEIGVADLGSNGRSGSDGDLPGTVFDTVVRDFDVDSNRAFASFRVNLDASLTVNLSNQDIMPADTLLPEIIGPSLG